MRLINYYVLLEHFLGPQLCANKHIVAKIACLIHAIYNNSVASLQLMASWRSHMMASTPRSTHPFEYWPPKSTVIRCSLYLGVHNSGDNCFHVSFVPVKPFFYLFACFIDIYACLYLCLFAFFLGRRRLVLGRMSRKVRPLSRKLRTNQQIIISQCVCSFLRIFVRLL